MKKLLIIMSVGIVGLVQGFNLVPQPQKVTKGSGVFLLQKESDIRYKTDATISKEGYRLKVTGASGTETPGITITSSDMAGKLYALQTLKQLTGDTQRNALHLTCPAQIPCCEIEDAPHFPWRGYMLDTSRHFFGTDVIKRALDTMAYHKLNVFHWHLVDGAGWRFPVKAYPELTTKCATRTNGKRSAVWGRNKETGTYGPFFHSREDITEVLAYAKARGISVVPEIDIPGHQGINGVFKFACCQAGVQPEGTNKWTGSTGDMCVGNQAAYRFYEKVFDELCEAFPSEIIHIGGDEVGGKDWARCPKCQRLMREKGLKNQRELQHIVMRHFADYLAKKGRRAIGWDEILEGGEMPSGTMMTHFHSGGKAHLAALAAGHEVVMMPGQWTYFDCEQGLREDPYDIYQIFNGRLDWRKAYAYDPLAGVPEKDRSRVLGLQGCSWTEIVCDEEDLDWGVYPRLACLAEVAWAYPATRDAKAFEPRLTAHRERLVKMGIGAANVGPLESPVPQITPKPAYQKLQGFTVMFAPEITADVVDWIKDETVPAGGYAAKIGANPYYAPGKICVRYSDEAGKDLAVKVLRQIAHPKKCGSTSVYKGEIRSYQENTPSAAKCAPATPNTIKPGFVKVVWSEKDGEKWTVEGLAEHETNRKMQTNTVFAICSNTKPIASVLALTFVEEGLINLDDPVSKYFPIFAEIKYKGKVPKKPILLRYLITHLSGLAYGVSAPGRNQDMIPYCEMVDLAVKAGLRGEPGEKYQYCGLGFQIMGAVLEKVSGRKVPDLMRERIFEPLGMYETTFYPDAAMLARAAIPYYYPPKGKKGIPLRYDYTNRWTAPLYNPARTAMLSGGLISTVGDYLKFSQMIVNKGVGINGRRILSEKMFDDYLFKRQTPIGDKTDASFDIGFNKTHTGGGKGGLFATSAHWNWTEKSCEIVFRAKSPYAPKGMKSALDATGFGGKKTTFALSEQTFLDRESSCLVSNNEDRHGIATLKLVVNGKTLAKKRVELAIGEAKRVTIPYVKKQGDKLKFVVK